MPVNSPSRADHTTNQMLGFWTHCLESEQRCTEASRGASNQVSFEPERQELMKRPQRRLANSPGGKVHALQRVWSETVMRIARFPLQSRRGITLSEVVISLAVSALMVAAVVSSYVVSARSADFISHSSAADAAAQARLEQTRAAKWDTAAAPATDELQSTNFAVQVVPLQVPVVGTLQLFGTNRTTIVAVSQDPPLKMVQVDCVWSYPDRGPFTNSVVMYRSPDQ